MLPLCPIYAMGLTRGNVFPWGFFLKVTHTRVPQGWSLVYKGEGLLKSSSCGVVFCTLLKFGLGERLIICIINGSRRCQRWSGSFEWMRRDLRVLITVLFVRSARPFCSGEYGAITSRVMPFSCRNCVKTPLVHSLASSEWRYVTSAQVNSGNYDFQVCISHYRLSTAYDFRLRGNAHLYLV